MSASGIVLVTITASLLRSALCSGQNASSTNPTVYDNYEGTTPSVINKTQITVTLQLPHLAEESPNFKFGEGRKKHISQIKKQFSPWGGKRLKPTEGGTKSIPQKRSIIPVRIRSFNSWDASDEKKYPLFGEKKVLILSSFGRNSQLWDKKHESFVPWSGKRSFNSWTGKKSFNSWGGKKSFNSWGNKRSFSSWGGKRSFNSWGGKRTLNSLEREKKF